jgi:dCMP deaminase
LFNFKNKELVRPNWDTYFVQMAELAASRSNCMKRGNGAVITLDNRIVSTGYNGTPFGMTNCNEGGCKRCNDNVGQGINLDKCFCLHAEESAVMEAGRKGCMGATIYTTSFPCLLCCKMIIQGGIKRVVFIYDFDSPISK